MQPIMRQAEQYPDATDFCRVAFTPEQPYHDYGHSGAGNLEPGEYMYNRDPEMGTTVPQMHGGDPAAAVTDARLMHPEETGLEYDVLARPAAGHGEKAFDVVKPLG